MLLHFDIVLSQDSHIDTFHESSSTISDTTQHAKGVVQVSLLNQSISAMEHMTALTGMTSLIAARMPGKLSLQSSEFFQKLIYGALQYGSLSESEIHRL